MTHVIYESPIRLSKTLEIISGRYPNAEVVVAREMTKIHEKIYNFKFEILNQEQNSKTKGEATILVYFPEI